MTETVARRVDDVNVMSGIHPIAAMILQCGDWSKGANRRHSGTNTIRQREKSLYQHSRLDYVHRLRLPR